ncbi:cupin domain-containing protein [Rhizobium lusitanum]|uniref:cupin domain-containing protein n=1 Tax=Rhizobium lusitanum TaxID=293958 RepID=UPI0019592A21|nr:cupin domain-containing protein [Rhizobium lusitanum]MBM7049224.1 cupin domain-containing protein [Rhizobium lusitanum]
MPRKKGVKPSHPKLGAKLRHARRMKGLKLSEVATEVGCSESLLSKIENDLSTPSVALLHQLAQALGSNIAWLFTENEHGDDIIVRKADRHAIDFGLHHGTEGTKVESVAPYVTDNLLQAMIFTIAPDGKTASALKHQGEDFGYVLEGSLTLLVDGKEYEIFEGDTFQFRSDRPHGYHNKTSAIAKVLWINTPPTF